MRQNKNPGSDEDDLARIRFDLSNSYKDMAAHQEDHNRRRYVNQECNPYEFRVKIDILFFDGHLDIEDFFGYMEIPLEK